jgi:hypothetical protein
VKVGKYEVPDIRLNPTLVEATKKLYEKFKSEETSDTLTVAKLLDHETDKSGAFLRKLACLRAYGLVEKRGIRVTDIGKKLTYGATEEEKNEALKEAILNIPLWKEFYSKFGVNLPTENFWVDLGKITGLEAPDAQKLEKIVRNAYLDDIRYLKSEKKQEEGVSGMGAESAIDTSMAIIEVKVGGYYQKLPYTEDGIKLAKGFLDLLENQLKVKAKPKEKASKEEG